MLGGRKATRSCMKASSRSSAPSRHRRSATSITRSSGVDAPAETPTVVTPSSHNSFNAAACGIRYAGQPVAAASSHGRREFELETSPTTRTMSTRHASHSTVFRDPVRPANLARFVFLDPRARTFYRD